MHLSAIATAPLASSLSTARCLFVVVTAAVPAAALAAEDARLAVSGDLRFRYEDIQLDPGTDVSRERFRGRLGVRAGLSDSVDFNFRLATGTGDPVSTNLNFGESLTADDIQLDRAYLDWQVNEALHLLAGKMKNPLFRPGDTSLNWDSDFNPQGVAADIRSDTWFGTAAAYQVADQGDTHSRLFAVQAGTARTLGRAGVLTAGLGYFDYGHTRGRTPFFRGAATGNTVDASGNYVYDYDIAELFLEFTATVHGVPIGLFGDWVRNLAAAREDRAFAVGVNVGRVKERGQFAVSWAWHDTDADAVIGTFTDSDLAGGNTDSRGHLFGLQYALTRNLVAGATFIRSEFGHFAGNVRDFDRVMLDMEFRF